MYYQHYIARFRPIMSWGAIYNWKIFLRLFRADKQIFHHILFELWMAFAFFIEDKNQDYLMPVTIIWPCTCLAHSRDLSLYSLTSSFKWGYAVRSVFGHYISKSQSWHQSHDTIPSGRAPGNQSSLSMCKPQELNGTLSCPFALSLLTNFMEAMDMWYIMQWRRKK